MVVILGNMDSPHLSKWVEQMGLNGLEVTVISNSIMELGKLDIKHIKLNSRVKLIMLFLMIYKLTKIKLENPNIIVHSHYIGYYAFAMVISEFFKKSNLVISSTWGSDIISNRLNRFKKSAIKLILSLSKIVTYESNEIGYILTNEFNVPKHKLRKIYFGVDTKKFTPNRPGELSPSSDRNRVFNLISTRNLEKIYDNITIIKAIKIIISKGLNVQLTLAGKGTQLNYLKETVSQLELDSVVKFLNGYSYDNLPMILNVADIYISSSLSDGGIAASTTEAMSCELPVIISDIEANKEMMIHLINCIKFNPGNAEQLAEQITRLILDENLRLSIAKRGRFDMVAKYDLRTVMRKNLEIYEF